VKRGAKNADDLLRSASDAADAVLYLWERNNWITSAEIAADALLDIRSKSISRKSPVIRKRINHSLIAIAAERFIHYGHHQRALLNESASGSGVIDRLHVPSSGGKPAHNVEVDLTVHTRTILCINLPRKLIARSNYGDVVVMEPTTCEAASMRTNPLTEN
jgi:hypothetical protein